MSTSDKELINTVFHLEALITAKSFTAEARDEVPTVCKPHPPTVTPFFESATVVLCLRPPRLRQVRVPAL